MGSSRAILHAAHHSTAQREREAKVRCMESKDEGARRVSAQIRAERGLESEMEARCFSTAQHKRATEGARRAKRKVLLHCTAQA